MMDGDDLRAKQYNYKKLSVLSYIDSMFNPNVNLIRFYRPSKLAKLYNAFSPLTILTESIIHFSHYAVSNQ